MKNQVPSSHFTDKDAQNLIAGYGRSLSPEKRTALLAKLEEQRADFARTEKEINNARQERSIERE